MYYYKTSIFFVILSLYSIAQSADSFDLTKFYQSLVKNNSTYLSSNLNLNQAVEYQEAGKGLYFPNLTLGVNQTTAEAFKSQQITSDLSGQVLPLGLSYSTTLYNNIKILEPEPQSNQGAYAFDMSINLLKNFGPRIGSAPFDLLDLDLKISQNEAIRIKYDLILELIETYMSSLASQKNLILASSYDNQAANDQKRSEQLFESGKIPKLSLLSISTQRQQSMLQVIQSEKNLRSSLSRLFTLTGLEMTVEHFFNAKLNLDPIKMPFFNETIIEGLIKKTFDANQSNNPILISNQLALKKEEIYLLKAEENVLPALSFGLNYTAGENKPGYTNPFPSDNPSTTAGLTLSMPVGFVAERRELAAARISMKKAQIENEQLKRKLKNDWEGLIQEYKLAKRQYDISKNLLKLLQSKYDTSIPTSGMGPTYQQNVINYKNEVLNTQISFNQLEVEILTLQFRILAFNSHSHALDFFKAITPK